MDALCAILAVPVVAQRSPEWYERRKTRITASEIASILGENPYEGAKDVSLRKRGLGKPFTGNVATRYGQAHESAAIAAYCAALGRVSFEVGLIDYEAIHGTGSPLFFLAGSPDGITVLREASPTSPTSHISLGIGKPQPDSPACPTVTTPRVVRAIGPCGDEPPPLVSSASVRAFLGLGSGPCSGLSNGLSNGLGDSVGGTSGPAGAQGAVPDPDLAPIMLEVKCPYRRAIVHGTIPKQYYAQVQINMLICGLPRADFVEYRPPPNFQLNIVRVVPDHAWLRAALPRIQHFHASLSVLLSPLEHPPPVDGEEKNVSGCHTSAFAGK